MGTISPAEKEELRDEIRDELCDELRVKLQDELHDGLRSVVKDDLHATIQKEIEKLRTAMETNLTSEKNALQGELNALRLSMIKSSSGAKGVKFASVVALLIILALTNPGDATFATQLGKRYVKEMRLNCVLFSFVVTEPPEGSTKAQKSLEWYRSDTRKLGDSNPYSEFHFGILGQVL